jgi:hypothetical protein
MALTFGCNMLTSLACEVDRQYDASIAEWIQARQVEAPDPQEQSQPSPLGTARACAFRQSNYQVRAGRQAGRRQAERRHAGRQAGRQACGCLLLPEMHFPCLRPQLKYHTKKIPVGENSIMVQAVRRIGELAAGQQPYSTPSNDLSPQAQALRLLRIGSNTVAGQQTTGMVLISFIAGGGTTFTASHDHVILDSRPFATNALLGQPGEVAGQLHSHGRATFHINNVAIYNDRGCQLCGVECSPFMVWMHYFKTRAGERMLQNAREQQQQHRLLGQMPATGDEAQQPSGTYCLLTATHAALCKS